MKCRVCGQEIEDGSLFCGYCGAMQAAEEQTPKIIFCPNCGKRFAEGERFCDECGTDMWAEDIVEPQMQTAEKTKQAKKVSAGKPFRISYVLVPAAVLVAAALLWGIVKLTGSFFHSEIPDRILYLKDGELMLADLSGKKKPVEITDDSGVEQLSRGDMALKAGMLGMIGDYVYFTEDYDYSDGTYTLYRTKVSDAGNEKRKEKIASGISRHQVLKNDRILYIKDRKLVLSAGGDTYRFNSDTYYSHDIDSKEKYVLWMEVDGSNYNDIGYYLQDLEQKKEKVEITRGNGVYCVLGCRPFRVLSDRRRPALQDRRQRR